MIGLAVFHLLENGLRLGCHDFLIWSEHFPSAASPLSTIMGVGSETGDSLLELHSVLSFLVLKKGFTWDRSLLGESC